MDSLPGEIQRDKDSDHKQDFFNEAQHKCSLGGVSFDSLPSLAQLRISGKS
jgi:hypothetical protein